MPPTDLDLDAILDATLAAHARLVVAWTRDEPGSWGALAGQAIVAARRALGRRLSDTERRIVWQALWDRLVLLRAGGIARDTGSADTISR